MKTKIFKSIDSEQLTKELNLFSSQHEKIGKKFFTQYQPVYLPHSTKVLYTAMVFYEED